MAEALVNQRRQYRNDLQRSIQEDIYNQHEAHLTMCQLNGDLQATIDRSCRCSRLDDLGGDEVCTSCTMFSGGREL